MVFERIKTVKGKQYKYLVENVRENGKVKQKIVKYLGRVGKEPICTNSINIPEGFYYFSQEDCDSCSSEKEVREFIRPFREEYPIIPELYYIDISKQEIPFNIIITETPTILIFKDSKMVVSGDLSLSVGMFMSDDEYLRISNKDRERRKKEKKKKGKCKDGVCPVPSSSANVSTT